MGINWIFKSSKELDITNEDSITKVFNNNKIDYLVNCAAYTAVDKAESEPEKAFLVNAEGVKLLANACKEYNATLIHISTDFVFDGEKTTPYMETDLPNPINVYGASKLKGEQYAQKILEKYFIIRTSWVYSQHGNNFVKTMLRLAKEKNEVGVVDDQIGSPTYAGDLAEVIYKIIKTKPQDYGLYHYSNIGEISWYGFSMAILEESDIKIKLLPIRSEEYLTSAKRPKFSVMHKLKIKENLNIIIPHWKDSLKEAVERLG